MNKWIDNNMNWIVSIALVAIFVAIAYFVSTKICMDCPPVNITSGDLIA